MAKTTETETRDQIEILDMQINFLLHDHEVYGDREALHDAQSLTKEKRALQQRIDTEE